MAINYERIYLAALDYYVKPRMEFEEFIKEVDLALAEEESKNLGRM